MATAIRNYVTEEVNAWAFAVCANRGGLEIIDELADEWRALCAESVDDQPFFRPEWFQTHLRVFFPGARVVLITARLRDKLCLVLPLVEERGTFSKLPIRWLRAPVNVHCGRYDAVRRVGQEGDAAIWATWKYLKECGDWDVLQVRYAPEKSTVCRLLDEARADGFRLVTIASRPNPYVPIPSQRDILQQLPRSARLRTKLRQVRRELASQGTLRFYRIDKADPDALRRFYELEASGWKGKEGSAVICDSQMVQFFSDAAEVAARHGYFCLYMLELSGQLIAAHYALILKGRCYAPKVAYDENFRQFAPGHLIVAEILKDCAARGVHGFDITGIDDEWKMKWTAEARPVNHHWVFAGPRGSFAYTLGIKLRPALRRLFPRVEEIS